MSLDGIYPPKDTGIAALIRRQITQKPDGIFLVAGPTGSGKSTTLAALLKEKCDGETKVLTVENPVEYQIDGAIQVEVTPHMDFPDVLRGFLRADPGVFMVGEIRDADTADIAIKAAQTGHLVVSTIHVRDSCAAPARLLDMVPGSAATLADTLNGVLAQRLVRKLCPNCSTAGRAVGCGSCTRGWQTRVAVGDLLSIEGVVVDAIADGAKPTAIRAAKDSPGFQDHAAVLVRNGTTTVDEVTSVLGFCEPDANRWDTYKP